MKAIIIIINGLVAGSGAYAYLEAETWKGSAAVVLIAGSIILLGEFARRTWNEG